MKLKLKAAKDLQDREIIGRVLTSPLVQMVGSVAIVELLEAGGILSSRWAGAVEGGVITMVALQALKDYGVIGAAAVSTSIVRGGSGGNDFLDYAGKAGALLGGLVT